MNINPFHPHSFTIGTKELLDMKPEKKLRGMKRRTREERKRKERIVLAAAASILIVFVSSFLANSMLNQPSTNQTVNSTSERKAAIVDQLSLTYPNQTFIQTATDSLRQAGYTVDYYLGENVTVEFYRNLPTREYGLMILRVHSTPLSLFSSEPYDKNKYVWEQLTDQLTRAKYYQEDEVAFFGITAQFVRSGMNGRFSDSAIVMMGCMGLAFADTAEAFVYKGAKVYISWNDFVLSSHTDLATIHLLRHLITGEQPVKQAIGNTMHDVGADPAYNSLLLYYPLEAGSYAI